MSNHKIEVDAEVFQLLQREARPFVDSPNDVLRRLLLPRSNQTAKEKVPMTALSAMHSTPGAAPISFDLDSFLREVIAGQFEPGLRRRAPYRLMFEDANSVVYFQNFGKETDHLWYRVTAKPWKELKSSRKSAWICFTNPVERYVYMIPVADIAERVHKSGYSRSFLEVNIDPATSKWTELNWDISDYRRLVGRTS